jgi:putative endonuclease
MLPSPAKNNNKMSKRSYYVYILANRAGVLYVGVTNDLERRIAEHRSGLVAGFTRQYNVTRLVHSEEFGEVEDAIAREKQIKGWRRSRKLALIEGSNPRWEDLAAGRDPSALRASG